MSDDSPISRKGVARWVLRQVERLGAASTIPASGLDYSWESEHIDRIRRLERDVTRRDQLIRGLIERMRRRSEQEPVAISVSKPPSVMPPPPPALNFDVAPLRDALSAMRLELQELRKTLEPQDGESPEVHTHVLDTYVVHEEKKVAPAPAKRAEHLAKVVRGLVEPSSPPAPLPRSPSLAPAKAAKSLHQHIEQLSREVLDQEIVIQSLLAQVEERDDRIRSLQGQANTEPPQKRPSVPDKAS